MADRPHRGERPAPQEIPAGFRRGCLYAGVGLLSLAAVAIGGFVSLLIIAEPAEGPVSSVSFRNCSPAEEIHLTEVHLALVENNRLLGSFDGLRAVSGRSELDLRMDLQRPLPMELTCVTSAECAHGIVPPGSIGLLEPAVELDVCDHKGPEADFCDSFAALAYGHARARRVVSERAEQYHAFIRAECGRIH